MKVWKLHALHLESLHIFEVRSSYDINVSYITGLIGDAVSPCLMTSTNKEKKEVC